MYGKHYESMYDGSMYGAGLNVFAVWGYVISHAREGRIELLPRKLADTLGGTVDEIKAALEFLCAPDPESRNKEHEGRRLVLEGEFQYFMPSWEIYQRMMNEADRREYNRLAKRRERAARAAKKAKKNGAITGEVVAVGCLERGDEAGADVIAAERRGAAVPAVDSGGVSRQEEVPADVLIRRDREGWNKQPEGVE